MAGLYLDTSSLGRVLLAEPDAILIIELRRLARREHLETAADRILASVRLTPITDTTIQRTSRLEPVDVRTLDAIHLDAAIELSPRRDDRIRPHARQAAQARMRPPRHTARRPQLTEPSASTKPTR